MENLDSSRFFNPGPQEVYEACVGLNQECVVGCCGSVIVTVRRPKRMTIEELDRILFPYDPIREYFAQEIEKIEQKYRWVKRMEDRW